MSFTLRYPTCIRTIQPSHLPGVRETHQFHAFLTISFNSTILPQHEFLEQLLQRHLQFTCANIVGRLFSFLLNFAPRRFAKARDVNRRDLGASSSSLIESRTRRCCLRQRSTFVHVTAVRVYTRNSRLNRGSRAKASTASYVIAQYNAIARLIR